MSVARLVRRAAARVVTRLASPRGLARLAVARGATGLALNYHVMRRARMEAHLDALGDLFDLVPLEELLERSTSGGRTGERLPATITVDDGKRSHLTEIAPALGARRVHGTFFVTSGPCASGRLHWFDLAERIRRALDAGAGAGPSLDHERLKTVDAATRGRLLAQLAERLGLDDRPADDDERPLTPGEVGALAAQGFTVGSHSATHPILILEPEAVAWRELVESRAQIAEWIGAPVRHFCYPNGNASPDTEALTRRAGYVTAWTTVPLWLGRRDNLHRLPRVQIYEHEDRADITLKLVRAALGLVANPDGSGFAYRRRRVMGSVV